MYLIIRQQKGLKDRRINRIEKQNKYVFLISRLCSNLFIFNLKPTNSYCFVLRGHQLKRLGISAPTPL